MFVQLNMTKRNQNYQNKKISIHPDVQRRNGNRLTFFSGRDNPWKKLPFLGNIANKFLRPTILQLNIEGLTASKINILHHLSLEFEAIVILLKKTHFPTAKKLVLSKLLSEIKGNMDINLLLVYVINL